MNKIKSKRACRLVNGLSLEKQGRATNIQGIAGKCLTEKQEILNKNSAEGYVAPGKDHVTKVLYLFTSSDNAVYLCQVLPKYLKGFQSHSPGQ